MSRYFLTSFILILLIIAPAMAWTPPGDINLGNLLSVFNSKNITTRDISISGRGLLNNSPICTAANGECGTSTGDISSVTVGNGLTGGGTTGDIVINLSATVCSTGEYSTFNGTNFICAVDSGETGSGGNISAVTASSGYIPKFTNSTNLNNSLIYDNGSAIGINILPTRATLDVAGNITVRLGANQIASFHDNSNASALSTIGISLIGTGGNGYVVSAGSATKSLIFGTGGSLNAISVGNERMRINGTDGRVSINTTVPTSTLDVAGTLNVTKTSYFGENATFRNNVSVAGNFSVAQSLLVNETSQFTDNVTIRVYAGKRLFVDGDSVPSTGTQTNYPFSVDTIAIGADGNYGYIQNFNSKPLFINPAGNNLVVGGTNSRTGFNTTSTDSTVQIVGHVGINTSTTGSGLNITNTYSGRGVSLRVSRPGSGGIYLTTAGGTPSSAQIGVEGSSGSASAPINMYVSTSGDYQLGDLTFGAGGGTTQPTMFVDVSGTARVGINTSSPNASLHVVGTIQSNNITVDQNLTVLGDLSTPSICLNGDCKSAWPSGTGGVDYWQNITDLQNSNVSTNERIDSLNSTKGNVSSTNGTSGYVARFTSGVNVDTGSIYDSGSTVGIATTSSIYPLTISSTSASQPLLYLERQGVGGVLIKGTGGTPNAVSFTANGTSAVDSMFLVTAAGNGFELGDVAFASRNTTPALMVDVSRNRVGILKSTPDYPLDVNGTVKIAGDTFVQDSELNWTSRAQLNVIDSAGNPVLAIIRSNTSYMTIGAPGGTPFGTRFSARSTGAMSILDGGLTGSTYSLGDIMMGPDVLRPVLFVDADKGSVCVGCNISEANFTVIGNSSFNGTSYHFGNILLTDGSNSNPSYGFINESGMGMYKAAASTIGFSIGSAAKLYITGSYLRGASNDLYSIANTAARSATVPTYSWRNDESTGYGSNGAGNLSLTTLAVERMRINSTGHVQIAGGNVTIYPSGNITMNGSLNVPTICLNDNCTSVWPGGSSSFDPAELYINITDLQNSNASTNARVDSVNSSFQSADGVINATISGVVTNITNLQTSNTSVYGLILQLGQNDTNLNSSINAVNTRVTTLNASYQLVDGYVNSSLLNLSTANASVNTRVSTLNTSIDGLYANVTALQGGTGNYYQNITDLQTSNTSTNTRVNAINSSLVAVQQNVTDLQNSNSSIKTRIDTLNSTVQNLLTSNTSIYTRIDTVNTTAQNLLTSNTTLFGLILQLGQNDTNLNASINAVNTRVTTTNSSIDGLYVNVTALQSGGSGPYYYTNITNLQTSNTTLFGLILQLGQNDTNLNNSNNAVNTRVTTINSSIDGLYANITSINATKGNISGGFNASGTLVMSTGTTTVSNSSVLITSLGDIHLGRNLYLRDYGSDQEIKFNGSTSSPGIDWVRSVNQLRLYGGNNGDDTIQIYGQVLDLTGSENVSWIQYSDSVNRTLTMDNTGSKELWVNFGDKVTINGTTSATSHDFNVLGSSNISGTVYLSSLLNCNIDTDADGKLVCGTDDGGSGSGNISGGSINGTAGYVATFNASTTINASSLYVNPITGEVVGARFLGKTGGASTPLFSILTDSDSGYDIGSGGESRFYDDGVLTFQSNSDGIQVPNGAGCVFPGIQSVSYDDAGICWPTAGKLAFVVNGNSDGGIIMNVTTDGVSVKALCQYPDSNPLMPCRSFQDDPEAQRRYMVTDIDTFVVGGAETGEYGTWGWTVNTLPTGGDITSTFTDFDVKSTGVISLGSGTVIGSNVSLSTDTSTSAGFWVNGSSGINVFYARVAADLTGHTANNYTTMVGFSDVQTKKIATDGVVAMYNSSKSTNWILATCNTNACTENISSVKWGNKSFVDIEVQVWNNTQALMFINGTLAATSHSNIPSGSTDLMWAGSIRHGNTNGTTESRLYVDYYGIAKVFNEARY